MRRQGRRCGVRGGGQGSPSVIGGGRGVNGDGGGHWRDQTCGAGTVRDKGLREIP